MNPNVRSFLGHKAKFDEARAVIIPAPYEQTVSYRSGTRYGPQAILDASQYLEEYDEELMVDICDIGIYTMEEVEPIMAGPEYMCLHIEKLVSELNGNKKLLVLLGGEHSLSLGMVKGLRNRYKDMSVLQIDAHADLRDAYQGTRFGHSSVMRRISEILPIVQVGIRSMCREEKEFIETIGRPAFFSRDITGKTGWYEDAIALLKNNVYLTIDMDVFDPSIMPSVGTPEPGGLGWYELLNFVKEVASMRTVVGFDMVELCPIPGNISPDFLCAKLLYKILGYIFFQGKVLGDR